MEQLILNLIKQENPDNPLQYVRNIVKDYSMEKLNEQILSCTDCSICDGNCKTIAHGNSNASIMFIGGTSLSDKENNDLALYDNESFTFLEQTFDMLNVNKEELIFSNAINCKPYKIINNEKIIRVPILNELNNCKVFINHLIEIVQPLVIVLFGPIALNAFQKNKSLTNDRGEWFTIKDIPTIVTYHPDYFFKMQGKKDEEIIIEQQYEFIDDIKKAFLYVKEHYPNIDIMGE